jgi:hypothetical protein
LSRTDTYANSPDRLQRIIQTDQARQQADIRDLRTAAAALLIGTSVVVSFLRGRALDLRRFPVLVAAGVVFFVVSPCWSSEF